MTASVERHASGWLAAWSRLNLSSRILVGLAAGIIIGLFFGEGAAALQPIADIYIRLMQMTVLPYLVVSLMLGFGLVMCVCVHRDVMIGRHATGEER